MKRPEATSGSETTDLVRRLALEAGQARSGRTFLASAFIAVAIVAVVPSLAVVLAVLGVRPDLSSVIGTWAFLSKVVAMALLAAGGVILVRGAAIPGMALRPGLALAPVIAFLGGAVILDHAGLSIWGAHPPVSVPICVAIIVIASLPALALILLVLRHGTPTHLRSAGFWAGLLAGAVGALAYTVACINDGALFVAVWYSTAVLLAAMIGALIGPKALAW